ncbi:sulfotransferase [Rhodanobacter sp. L36]|uniref:tetratricopeptide repeat-containing sulfotransferase family protein n=1 Tax=Rhodanobacter sp. L36 TaxID=1747221 RepID=UPI00131BD257|nr:sulfotransferase [Rhodanobacter sp. L36]
MSDTAALLSTLTLAFNQHDWRRAWVVANELLMLSPRHPAVHYVAGVSALELQLMPKALSHLHQAADLDPDNIDVLTHFAKALAIVKMSPEARKAADRAMALSPGDAITYDTLGVVYTQIHAHVEARNAFERAVALDPNQASYRFNLATSLLATGEISGAREQLEHCIRLDPQYWKAHSTLAQQSRQTVEDNHISRLESLLSEHQGNSEAQTYLHMALGKEHEDCAEFLEAFEHYTLGKSAAAKGTGYSIAQDEALFAEIMAAFPADQLLTGLHEAGSGSDEPIFVIGMPRSGTTLVERIISSHPDVYSAGELLNFGLTLKHLSGTRTPMLLDLETIKRASGLDGVSLGTQYIASTRPATGKKPHFIDKLPHNFLYAGWIARALPNAKIICLRRDPVDTCLSNFRQLFARHSPNFGYALNLVDTGRYYIMFDRLMVHWQRVLPGRILEISYEALVQSQENRTRELLEFCGLPWNDLCLQFEHNSAPVNTASVVQVRSPIYRTSLKRWKKYESQLGELLALLRAGGIAIEAETSR